MWLVVLWTSSALAADDAVGPTATFSALWARRSMLTHGSYRALIVEVLSPKPGKDLRGSQQLRLRAVGDLSGEGKAFQPFEVKVTVSLQPPTRTLATGYDSKHYLALLREYNFRGQKRWNIYQIFMQHQPPRTLRYAYLVPVGSPDGAFAQAVRDLIVPRPGGAGSAKPFERMLAYLDCEDGRVRELASSFAAVNGWGFSGSEGQQHQPDAFARALLATKDAATRRRLAQAYSSAKADLLPREAELLGRVWHHPDEQVRAAALGENLRHASDRARELVGLLREAIGGTDATTRLAVLNALTSWADRGLILQPELEAIARGRRTPAPPAQERRVAVRILVDAGAEGVEKIIRDTLVEVPSAVALEYAVEERLYAVAPEIIRAARSGKLAWTEIHAAALSLLTRRFPQGEFEQFNEWWAGIEQAGQTEAMVAGGFTDPSDRLRARQLIEQLGSQRYRLRREAREKLSKLGMLVLPALEAATRHSDPAVATAADQLIKSAKATFAVCRNKLTAAAGVERSGKSVLEEVSGSDEKR